MIPVSLKRPANRSSWVAGLAGAATLILAAPVWAQVPPAVDRLPQDALVVASVRNLGELRQNMERIAGLVDVPVEEGGFAEFVELLDQPGVNADGSAAMAVLPGEENEEGEPPMVAVLPVSDFAAFVKAFGGTGEGPVEMVQIDGNDVFIKNLEGGFAAMSDREELLAAFAGEAGSAAAFEKMLGPVGQNIAESANLLVITNIPALAPAIREGYEMQKEQMLGMAAAMNPGQEANTALIDHLVETFLRDAQAGVMGLSAGEGGISLDFGAQFKEGSELAGRFDAEGQAASLLGNLPDMPYYFAMATDVSSAGIKGMIKQLADVAAEADPEGAKAMGVTDTLMKQLDNIDGVGFLLGTSPALMGGGILINSVQFIKTDDPAAYIESTKAYLTQLDDTEIQGVKYDTAFEPAAATVAETEAAAWSVRMQLDPADPMAQQMQMSQMMIFGPTGGPGGFIAPAEGGVVMTFSRNSQLLEQALTAAATPEGLGTDETLKGVQGSLPAGRVFEGYIGTKSILETAMGFIGMMAGPIDFQPPADLPPVGLGGTTDSGGVRMNIFVPNQVITTFKDLGAAVEEAQGGMEDEWEDAGEDEEDAGQPRF